MDDATRSQIVTEMESLRIGFSETRHAINNAVAVIMAQAEMSQQNPARYPRLAESVLERGQEVVDRLAAFTQTLDAVRARLGQG